MQLLPFGRTNSWGDQAKIKCQKYCSKIVLQSLQVKVEGKLFYSRGFKKYPNFFVCSWGGVISLCNQQAGHLVSVLGRAVPTKRNKMHSDTHHLSLVKIVFHGNSHRWYICHDNVDIKSQRQKTLIVLFYHTPNLHHLLAGSQGLRVCGGPQLTLGRVCLLPLVKVTSCSLKNNLMCQPLFGAQMSACDFLYQDWAHGRRLCRQNRRGAPGRRGQRYAPKLPNLRIRLSNLRKASVCFKCVGLIHMPKYNNGWIQIEFSNYR